MDLPLRVYVRVSGIRFYLKKLKHLLCENVHTLLGGPVFFLRQNMDCLICYRQSLDFLGIYKERQIDSM